MPSGCCGGPRAAIVSVELVFDKKCFAKGGMFESAEGSLGARWGYPGKL